MIVPKLEKHMEQQMENEPGFIQCLQGLALLNIGSVLGESLE